MKRSNQTRRSSRVQVVWDDENLHMLDTSKSPKQKITEPKTPYYAPDVGDGGLSPTPDDDSPQMNSASHAEAVRNALYGVATEDGASSSRSSGGSSSSNWNYNEDELDGVKGDEDGNHAGSFEEHRRKHYDSEYENAKFLVQEPEHTFGVEESSANWELGCGSVAQNHQHHQ